MVASAVHLLHDRLELFVARFASIAGTFVIVFSSNFRHAPPVGPAKIRIQPGTVNNKYSSLPNNSFRTKFLIAEGIGANLCLKHSPWVGRYS